MDFDKRVEELFLDLPEMPASAVQAGKLVFIGGVLPWREGKMAYKGRVGLELNLDAGRLASHAACQQALGILRKHLGGSFNKVRQVVSLRGFIASGTEFHEQDKVLDGAAKLLQDVFGPAGKPVRSSVGVTALPHDAAVELELVVEMK